MLFTVVPVITLLIVLSVVALFGFTQVTQTLVEQRDTELVQLAARQVAKHWADSALLLAQVAAVDATRGSAASSTQELLDASMALRQRFDEISVTDSQGAVVATVGGEIGAQVGGLQHFLRARRLRRPVRSSLYNDSRGYGVISVAVPSYDVWGDFSGCVLGVWHLGSSRLGLTVTSIRVGQGGFAYLIDGSGTILYHPSSELVHADASKHPAVAALLRNEVGAQTLVIDGQRTVVGYSPISPKEQSSSLMADESWESWGLLTSESWVDLIAPVRPWFRLMVVLLLLVVAIPLVIQALVSQRIAAPLASLVTQAERVASGEFSTQVSLNSGPSELRELELAFNKMVGQLRQYQSDIQKYVVSILTSQEQERKRVARELHDDTAQDLVVLGRRIDMAEELTEDTGLVEELEVLRGMTDDALEGVRRFTRDLRPPLLEELGLPRSLEILADRVDREEAFEAQVTISGNPQPLLPELELALYRLTQEGLSNIRRHAQASSVEVTLTYAPDVVLLEIVDDGVGFVAPSDPSELMRTGRLGLMGIHERARLFGGRAMIRSRPGQGTEVRVVIPLSSIVMPRVTGGLAPENVVD